MLLLLSCYNANTVVSAAKTSLSLNIIELEHLKLTDVLFAKTSLSLNIIELELLSCYNANTFVMYLLRNSKSDISRSARHH